MQGQRSTALTNWLAMPSGGASPQSYTMPLILGPSMTAEPTISIDWQGLPPLGGVQWQISDVTADWKAHFSATVDITGQLPPNLQQALFYRMICVYLIGHLHDKSLPEACETSLDIYKYQDAPDQDSTYVEPQARHVSTSKPRQIGHIW